MLAIKGTIDKNSKVFDYYDGTISKTVSRSYFLTFPWLLIMYLRHEKSEEINNLYDEIDAETRKVPELVEIRHQLIHYTHHYLVDQHYVTFKIFTPFVFLALGARDAKERFRDVVTSTFFNPETSVSAKYTRETALC